MSKKSLFMIIVALLAISLTACTRAASTAPLATPSLEANFPQPVATSGMNAIEQAGTQTAIATAGLPVPPALGTPDPNQTPPAEMPAVVLPMTPVDSNAASTALPSPTPGMPAAPAAANTPAPAVQTSKPGSYTLHEGEFPYCLARRFNVNPDELLALNGLSSSQSYYAPGTVIRIPQTGNVWPGARALKAHPAQYTVRSGDTIYSVACDFGDVDPQAIAAANGGNANLTTGTTIQIP